MKANYLWDRLQKNMNSNQMIHKKREPQCPGQPTLYTGAGVSEVQIASCDPYSLREKWKHSEVMREQVFKNSEMQMEVRIQLYHGSKYGVLLLLIVVFIDYVCRSLKFRRSAHFVNSFLSFFLKSCFQLIQE